MKYTLVLAAAAVLVAMPAAPVSAQAPDCEAARCAVQAEINQHCSCEQASNHGRYVSCVAHVVKRLSRDGTVPTQCKGKIKRCAARSTCGKAGFVACTITELGTCSDAAPGDGTAAGTCDEPAGQACDTNADCVISSRCTTKSSAELCTSLGGTPGAGSCCAACGG